MAILITNKFPKYINLTASSVNPPSLGLILGWNNISNANLLVGDASDVNDWNTFFNLPTNGTPFTSVTVVGNNVELYGGSNIHLRNYLFNNNSNLLSVNDEANCIITTGEAPFNNNYSLVTCNLPSLTTAGYGCFINCASLTAFNLPALVTAGDGCFLNCQSATSFNLPSCINLGSNVEENFVFDGIYFNTITLTVPSALMTCNSGVPDGDILYLYVYDTLTVITV
jgi:hypothetical protein